MNIPVLLGDRSYNILIGTNSRQELASFLEQKTYSKIFILTDENVAKLHLGTLEEVLQELKMPVKKVTVKPGEQSKSFAFLEKICEEILLQGIDRKSLIIAFGGGVIGDLAGFIASILLRGIDFIQMPTTLLSMVDSSVGGKTAINSKFGKNLIGSFYQPKLVVCDLEFLKTLPERELRSGYAEVVKYGFIRDKKFFEFLEKNHEKILMNDENFLTKIVTRSCEIKAEIVGSDEREAALGDRILLNFGHTFGHIFETETGYSSELLHGESVGLGMAMAAKMSQNFGMISEADYERIKNHLLKAGFIIFPKKIRKNWDKKSLIRHLYRDKKIENKHLTFILLEAIGKAVAKRSVGQQDFEKVLGEFLSA